MKRFVFLVGFCMVFLGDCLAGYPEEGEWSARRDLYSRLANDSTLLSDSLMNVFWEEMENSGESGFEDVRNETDNLYRLSPVSQEQLDDLRQNIVSLLDSLVFLDSLLQTTQDTFYLQSQRLLRTQIKDLEQQAGAIMQGLLALQDNIFDYLEVENGLLPNQKVYEANEQRINEILFRIQRADSLGFTEQEVIDLDNIANQCPLSGGKSVYIARALYVAVSGNSYYNDENLCTQAGLQYRQGHISREVETIKAYPNPVENALHIEIPSNWQGESTIRLMNMIGNICINAVTQERTHKLDVSKLTDGVYLLQITGNGFTTTEKIIIAH